MEIQFKAFPEVKKDDIYWSLDTPQGEVKLKPGQKVARFTASDLEMLETNEYKTELNISKIINRDNDAEHKLVIKDSKGLLNVVPIDILVEEKNPPVVVPPTEDNNPEDTEGKSTHYMKNARLPLLFFCYC